MKFLVKQKSRPQKTFEKNGGKFGTSQKVPLKKLKKEFFVIVANGRLKTRKKNKLAFKQAFFFKNLKSNWKKNSVKKATSALFQNPSFKKEV